MGKSLRDAYRKGRGAPIQAPAVKPNRRSGLYIALEVAMIFFHGTFFAVAIGADNRGWAVFNGAFLVLWSAFLAAEITHARQRRQWRKPFGPI